MLIRPYRLLTWLRIYIKTLIYICIWMGSCSLVAPDFECNSFPNSGVQWDMLPAIVCLLIRRILYMIWQARWVWQVEGNLNFRCWRISGIEFEVLGCEPDDLLWMLCGLELGLWSGWRNTGLISGFLGLFVPVWLGACKLADVWGWDLICMCNGAGLWRWLRDIWY